MKGFAALTLLLLAGCSSVADTPPRSEAHVAGALPSVQAAILADMRTRGYEISAEAGGSLVVSKRGAGSGFLNGLMPSTAATRLVTVINFAADGAAVRVTWASEWRTHMPDGKTVTSGAKTPPAVASAIEQAIARS